MAVRNRVTARELGKSYAAAVREDPAAKRLWVSTEPEAVELWLLIDPVGEEARRRFFEPVASMYDRFPDADLRFHVIDPGEYERFDLGTIVPRAALEIPLRPK